MLNRQANHGWSSQGKLVHWSDQCDYNRTIKIYLLKKLRWDQEHPMVDIDVLHSKAFQTISPLTKVQQDCSALLKMTWPWIYFWDKWAKMTPIWMAWKEEGNCCFRVSWVPCLITSFSHCKAIHFVASGFYRWGNQDSGVCRFPKGTQLINSGARFQTVPKTACLEEASHCIFASAQAASVQALKLTAAEVLILRQFESQPMPFSGLKSEITPLHM